MFSYFRISLLASIDILEYFSENIFLLKNQKFKLDFPFSNKFKLFAFNII